MYTNVGRLFYSILEKYGLLVEKGIRQTDNGGEYCGSWSAKKPSAYTIAIESAKLFHSAIPPGSHRFQSDVETVHNLIETEFYEIETFILNGDIEKDSLLDSGNAIHVVFFSNTIASSTVLDGFYYHYGLRIKLFQRRRYILFYTTSGTCAPQIENCTITNNYSAYYGGGMYTCAGAGCTVSPTVTNCSFTNNTAAYYGGAVQNYPLTGTCGAAFSNCTFTGNTTTSYNGGAISNYVNNSGNCPPLLLTALLPEIQPLTTEEAYLTTPIRKVRKAVKLFL